MTIFTAGHVATFFSVTKSIRATGSYGYDTVRRMSRRVKNGWKFSDIAPRAGANDE